VCLRIRSDLSPCDGLGFLWIWVYGVVLVASLDWMCGLLDLFVMRLWWFVSDECWCCETVFLLCFVCRFRLCRIYACYWPGVWWYGWLLNGKVLLWFLSGWWFWNVVNGKVLLCFFCSQVLLKSASSYCLCLIPFNQNFTTSFGKKFNSN